MAYRKCRLHGGASGGGGSGGGGDVWVAQLIERCKTQLHAVRSPVGDIARPSTPTGCAMRLSRFSRRPPCGVCADAGVRL